MSQLGVYAIACVLILTVLALTMHSALHDAEQDMESMKPRIIRIEHTTRQSNKFNALKLNELRAMDPFAFERYCATLLRCLGHPDAYATQEGGDGGKDVIFTDSKTGKKYYSECKRYGADNTVGRPIIQKLVGSALADNAIPYAVFTTGRFTQEALIEAKKTGVRCIGPRELLNMIEKAEELEKMDLESSELNTSVSSN